MQGEGKAPLAHYLRGNKLEPFQENLAKATGMTRVCAISDTHLVHDQMVLPAADVLVHAGDVMTESLLRHVKDGTAKAKGEELFVQFAEWFCSRPHPHKVLIAGNHDGAMEAIGAKRIREILDKFGGNVVYLEHQTASVGQLKVFGSPFGNWGSHNNAFSIGDRTYEGVEKGTHIIVTHSPPILPGKHGLQEYPDMVDVAVKSGALLSVSGHCHWAYGAYQCAAKPQGLAFIIASNCGSGWKNAFQQEGKRLDGAWDRLRGGYNLSNPPIVVDLPVETPKPTDRWILR